MTALALALAALVATDTVRVAGVPLRPARFPAVQEEPAADDWLGEDKFKHFTMSFAITAFAYSGARIVFDRDPSIGIALAAGSAAGVLKEIRDRSVGQPFSVRDLAWDAAGVVLGYFVIKRTD